MDIRVNDNYDDENILLRKIGVFFTNAIIYQKALRFH